MNLISCVRLRVCFSARGIAFRTVVKVCIVLCAFLACTAALAVVPMRFLPPPFPVNDSIASLSKVIESKRLESTALAEVYRERGIRFMDLNRYEDALADFTQALNLNGNYATVYINRADMFAVLERYNEAFADFASAQKLSPNNTAIYATRGALNFLLGRFEDAINDFKYYLQLKPGDMYRMLWLHLSEKYLNAPSTGSLQAYAKGLNLEVWPGALLRLYLGEVEAKDFIDAYAKKLGSFDAQTLCEGYYYLGQYFLLSGEKQLAADAFAQAVKTHAVKTIEYKFSVAYLARLRSGG